MPTIPNYTDPAFQRDRTDAQLMISILDGKGTFMPSNRGRVTPEEAADLVAFVRSFGPKVAVAAPPRGAPRTPASDAAFIQRISELDKQMRELEQELQKAKGKQ